MLWLKRYWPLVLGLLYLASPIDALPDTVLGLGWIDDLLVLLLVWWLFRRLGRASSSGRAGGYSTGRDRASSDQAPPEPGKRNPYEVLGVSPGATEEEIKNAYHRQAQRYHPDRVSYLGEEFQQLAKEKFQEIQQAYETLNRRAR